MAADDADCRRLSEDRPDGCELTGLTRVTGSIQTVTVRWLGRGDAVRSARANVRLSPPRRLPVLTRPVPKGTAVTPADLSWQGEPAPRAPLLPSTPVPIVPPAGLPNTLPAGLAEATRDLAAGSVLDPRAVRAVPLVKSGQLVTVESTAGGVRVSRTLKAARTGTAGQTIPLRLPDSRETVLARVVGNRRAVIVAGDLTGPAGSPPYAAAGGPASSSNPPPLAPPGGRR